MKFIRQYKLAYQIFNFFKKRQLVHNLPLYKKYGIHKKYHESISSEDFIGIESPTNKYEQLNSREEMPNDPDFCLLPESIQDQLLSWSDDGYVILENFFTENQIDTFNQEVDRLIKNKKVKWRYGNKIMFAIHHSQLLFNAGANERLLSILKLLLGKEVDLFQSINFYTGSEQRTHSDSIHMSTFPYGNLIAVWIAMEDIKPDSGPLHYYPGSHKLPYIWNRNYGNIGSKYKLGSKSYADYEDKVEEIIAQSKLDKKIFLPQKGDLLIWHANLLHGGELRTNPERTRRSMVFHYYAKDSICFHEITQRPTLKRK